MRTRRSVLPLALAIAIRQPSDCAPQAWPSQARWTSDLGAAATLPDAALAGAPMTVNEAPDAGIISAIDTKAADTSITNITVGWSLLRWRSASCGSRPWRAGRSKLRSRSKRELEPNLVLPAFS